MRSVASKAPTLAQERLVTPYSTSDTKTPVNVVRSHPTAFQEVACD